jgi:hypothetical protein
MDQCAYRDKKLSVSLRFSCAASIVVAEYGPKGYIVTRPRLFVLASGLNWHPITASTASQSTMGLEVHHLGCSFHRNNSLSLGFSQIASSVVRTIKHISSNQPRTLIDRSSSFRQC